MIAQHFVVCVMPPVMVLMALVMIKALIMAWVTEKVKALVKGTLLVKDSVMTPCCFVLLHSHWVVVDYIV